MGWGAFLVGSRHIWFDVPRDVPPTYGFNIQTWNFITAAPGLQGRRCKKFGVRFQVQAKHRRHVTWFHKHKNKSKYVKIRLEMLFSAYISVRWVKMDILPRKYHKVDVVFSQGGWMGYPVWDGAIWSGSPTNAVLLYCEIFWEHFESSTNHTYT